MYEQSAPADAVLAHLALEPASSFSIPREECIGSSDCQRKRPPRAAPADAALCGQLSPLFWREKSKNQLESQPHTARAWPDAERHQNMAGSDEVPLLPLGSGAEHVRGYGAISSDVEKGGRGDGKGSIGVEIQRGGSTGSKLARATIRVGGMTCASCVGTVEAALRATEGVRSASVALITETAEVEFDSSVVGASALAEEVEDVGFDATVEKVQAVSASPGEDSMRALRLATAPGRAGDLSLFLNGTIARVHGVVRCAVLDDDSSTVQVQYDQDVVGPRDIFDRFAAGGFNPDVKSAGTESSLADRQKSDIKMWKLRLLISLTFTLPCVAIMLWMQFAMPSSPLRRALVAPGISFARIGDLAMWALATPVQFVSGGPFYTKAIKGLRRCNLDMAFLVAMSTSAAYFTSALFLALQAAGVRDATECPMFFDTSTMLVTFVLLGKYLESVARSRTTDALGHLMALTPETAVVVGTSMADSPDFKLSKKERTVPSALLQRNDVVRVVPGARVPADGVVVSGTSATDESMLTGESTPVTKEPGSVAVGGTLNLEGMLLVRVTGVGQDTALCKIVKLVSEAQNSKPSIQAYADTVSRWFVPSVAIVALITFSAWLAAGLAGAVPAEWNDGTVPNPWILALNFGMAVLVIACPCALGLATPTAIMVGTGVAAKAGILIKSGEALETASTLSAVVFDKTGTLTRGQPAVTDWWTAGDRKGAGTATVNEAGAHILALVASAERASDHPVARAIIKHAENQNLRLFSPTDSTSKPGFGLSCSVAGRRVHVGSERYMVEVGAAVDSEAQAVARALEADGKSLSFAAVGGMYGLESKSDAKTVSAPTEPPRLVAIVGLSDVLKPNARGVVAALQRSGLDVYMVTGDSEPAARAVARQVGIPASRVRAGVLPGGKSTAVRALQSGGAAVAMLGDGINDAPALAQADLGVALAAGTNVSMEAADMVLVNDSLEDLLVALHLSRFILTRIRWNLLWALGYNVLGIPVAAGVLFPVLHVRLPSAVAGLLMALSSVSVVTSSLLIKTYQKPKFLHPETASARDATVVSPLPLPALPATSCSCDPGVRPEKNTERVDVASKVIRQLRADCAVGKGQQCQCKGECKCRGCCGNPP